MSRSYKKVAIHVISRSWTRFKEHGFRRRLKQDCHSAEVDFDPDRDWLDAQSVFKKSADYGTKLGMDIVPNPDESPAHRAWYERWKRK